MDKLTGVLEFDTCKIPFYKNDYVFDFTTLDISLFQQWLPPETKPTTEGFVTGKNHSGYFIAIYTGQKVFRVNAPSSLHTFLYITSKNNASDIWTGNPFDGITFCGGCIDKIYQANAIESNDLFKENEITLKLNNAKKTFNFTDDNGQKINVLFSTNVTMNRSVEKGFSIKENGQYLNLSFENKQTLNDVPEIIQRVCRIISCLVFRQNLHFDKIYLTRKTERADHEPIAEVHLEQIGKTQKSFSRIITIEQLENKIANFFSLIWNKKIGTTSYIPEQDSDARVIKSIDIKEICSALEYEIDHTSGLLSKENESLKLIVSKDDIKDDFMGFAGRTDIADEVEICIKRPRGTKKYPDTDEEIHTVVEKVAGVIDETLIETVMQGQQVPQIFGISRKVPQHEDFTEKLSQDKINFYNKWTHANTKLGAPLLFSELSDDESTNIEGAKMFFANDPEEERRYIFLRDEFAKTLNGTDREIYYLLEKGITQKEIAKRLGYKTHSAVSKRMKIMNKDFKEFLGFEN